MGHTDLPVEKWIDKIVAVLLGEPPLKWQGYNYNVNCQAGWLFKVTACA